MHLLKSNVIALVASLGIAGATFAADAAAPASKWHLLFAGHANEAGDIQFRVTPAAGEAMMVTVKVGRGHGEYTLAQDALKAFKSQLPKERFRTDLVHGQELMVRTRDAEPAFLVEALESTATGAKASATGE